EKLAAAESAQTARQIVQDITAISNLIDTQMNLWSIRHSIDMTDDFYNEETKFWNEHSPLFSELSTNYYRVIVDSPYRKELADLLPETFF
ncbi:M3 family oligoendopeptidase, partial [Bacillus cereus group sp. Bce002]